MVTCVTPAGTMNGWNGDPLTNVNVCEPEDGGPMVQKESVVAPM
jgi:hypothetical protein